MISFAYPGGKARIRAALIDHFPEEGRYYWEPFAGRGNVFWLFYYGSAYEQYWLNDIQTAPFFRALRTDAVEQLPNSMTRSQFEYWKYQHFLKNPVAALLEPQITFRGAGYRKSFNDSIRYNATNYRRKCELARSIMRDHRVIVQDRNYDNLPWGRLNDQDFVYLDPPYVDTDNVGYKNIDHEGLCKLLDGSEYSWALSGYMSELYLAYFGEPTFQIERNHEMCDDPGATTLECLWVNLTR